MSALLERAWRDGVFLGDADPLAAAAEQAPGDVELAAFAAIAAARQGRIEAARTALAAAGTAEGADLPARTLQLAAAAWAAAVTAEPVAELMVAQLERALRELRLNPGEPIRRRMGRAMAELALAECAVAASRLPDARSRWRRIAEAAQSPPGPSLYARERLAATVGLEAPSRACGAFESLAEDADRQGHGLEAVLGLRQASLLALIGGQRRRAQGLLERLARHPAASDGDRHYALTFRAIVSERPEDEVMGHLAESIQVAAAAGDGFGYVLSHVLAARAELRRDGLEDAIAILTTGIAQLERSGQGFLAVALREERDRIREEVGAERFEAAVDALLAG